MNTYFLIGGIILVGVICYYSMFSSQESVKTEHSKVQEPPTVEEPSTIEESSTVEEPPKIKMEDGDKYIGLISPTNNKTNWFKKHYLFRRVIDNKAYYYITLHTDDRTPITIPYHMGNPIEEEKLKVDDVIIPKGVVPGDDDYTLEELR